ncbi:MAG: hypothetical protein HQ541_06830, partial [Mariniphaga sp.]|nr:hypothetical protein [Mariniphaga sp.]
MTKIMLLIENCVTSLILNCLILENIFIKYLKENKDMKTRNWILVILAIAFTTNVFATKTPKMNIIALDDSKALVAVQQ